MEPDRGADVNKRLPRTRTDIADGGSDQAEPGNDND